MGILPFQTRTAAGRILAGKLGAYAGKKNVLILGLVRGGVEIGSAMAAFLSLPLFPYIVRKLGHPGHREFGIGAIAEGGATYLEERTMRSHGVEWTEMEPVIAEEMAELKRRKEAYAVRKRPPLKGNTVILCDDGAATGVTMFAAIQDMKKAKVKKIVVALPVCPPDTAERLGRLADETVFLATPEPFDAVGKWYVEFPQLSDEDVLKLLKQN
ncbi:MAG: phosphoribosyltransferase family protein [Candidatus Peribacteraceae bacterium]